MQISVRSAPSGCWPHCSDTAIEVAKENSESLKVKLDIRKVDIFEWQPDSKYDIMVSNPPYVQDKEALEMEKNVLDYEPHEALFVRDEEPLVFYDRISDLALSRLNPGGKLYFEVNPLTVNELKKMLEKKGCEDVNIYKDSFGKDRFISCHI